MTFDYEGARKEGYSDDEIADYLAKESKFDVAGARKEGYTSKEVIDFLGVKAAPPAPASAPRSEVDQQLDQPYFPRSGTRAGVRSAKDRPIDPTANASSVMADVPAGVGAPERVTQSLAPVRPEVRKSIEDAYNAGDAKTRAKIAGAPGYLGQIGTELKQRGAAVDAAGAPTLDVLDPRAEARGRRIEATSGMDPAAARVLGRADAALGKAPGAELPGIAGPTEVDFEAARKWIDANPVLRGAAKGGVGLVQGWAGLGEAMADTAFGDAPEGSSAARWAQRKEAEIGDRSGALTRNFEGALASIAQQLPSMALGIATGSEALTLAGLGLQSFGQEYLNGKKAGLDPTDRTTRAAIFSAFEVAGEKLGLGTLLGQFRKAARGVATEELIPVLAKNLASKEIPGELFTYAGEFATDKSAIGVNRQATMEDFLRGASDTIIQTVMQGGLQTGGAHAVNRAVQALSPAPIPEPKSLFSPAATAADLGRAQVFQSPEAEAAGLPPLVVPPKSAAAVAADAAKAGEKPAGAAQPAEVAPTPQEPPKWAPEPVLSALDRAAAEVTAPAPGAAQVSIDGKSSENANVPAPAAAAGEPAGTAADTQAVAPEAAVRPAGDQLAAAPSAVPDTPVAGVPVSAGAAKSEQGAGLSSEVNAGVEATARMAGLLQNARRGFDQATAEYERTGQSPTYAKLRKHLMSNLLPLLGRKHAEAYTHWLTEEGGLGEGDFGMGSEYFDLAVQGLVKRATAGAEPTVPAPAPIDLPESFASKSDASLFLSKNKLSDVRVVQAGNAWTIQPAARPDTAQEIAQNERRVVSLNEGLVKTGTTERAALVRDTGTEQGAITRAIGQIFGLPQVTVSGLASQAVYYKGVSYVSNKLDTAARVINGALHEAFHWAVQAHPDVAERYLDAVNPYLKTGVLEARQTFENKNKLPGEKDFPITAGRGDTFGKVNSAEEENAADLWGDMGGDPQLWVEMRQKDPGLFRAIRYRFLETLARAITALSRKGFKVNKLVTEYDKVRDATSTAMAEVAKRSKPAKAAEAAAPRAQEATEPDVRASKIDEDTVKREDGSRDYALNVERKERKRGKRGALTVEEQAAVEHDAATHGVDAAEWIAKAEKKKRNYPESAGWAPLRLLGLEVKETTNEDGEVEKEIDLKWQKQGYSYQTPPGKTKGPNKVDTRWAEQMAVRVAAEVRSVLKRAAAGDRNALIIVQHQTWYRNMAKALRLAFGGKGDFFADLLGATSPQTDVPVNWRSAVDIIKRFSRGEFRREMKAALEWIDAGKDPRDMPGGDKIRKLSGKLYGINSPNAVRALLNLYRGIEPGSAPKAKNFAMNLIGESDMATIDVWAARLLRRMAQAIEKVGYERIAPPAEKGVTGKWSSDASQVGGEFGFGAVVMRLTSSILKDEGVDVSAPDLQAIAWFIEKELWTKHNWTSKTGEGGSFEEQLDNTKPERLIVGWTIATGDHVPSDVEMSIAQARVMAVLRGDDTVLAARALPTTGMYAGDKERSFDTELVVGPGFDPAPLIAEIAHIAQEAKQYDVFVSKVLPDDMGAPNARPGVEVYFRGQKAFDDAKPILDEIVNNGLDGFTLVVDPRTEDSDAPGGEVGKYVGVRLQYIPEIEMRWSDPTSERYRVLSRGTPEELAALIEDKALEMTRAADKIRERADVAHSTVRWYDTIVIGKENYSDYTDGAQQEAPGQDGSRAWFGQPLGEVLARADSRLRGEQRQEPDASVRDGGDAGGQAEADVRRSKADGPAEPPGGSGRSGIAGEQRDAGAAQAWSKRPPQPGSATVDAWHYGLERTGVLSGLYYGRGIKGEERERVFADPDWRVQRRVYFYIPKGDGTLPAKEKGLGNHRYEQRLGNLYDGAVGDSRVGPSSAADFETKVLDAGYDGYISRKLGMAVVLNADVPVNYTGVDQHGPARAEPPAQARLKKALLRGEIDAVDAALPALKAADPTLRVRNGSVEYDPAARDALNAVPGEGLPRFSKAFREWFGDSKAAVAVNAETGKPLVNSREPKKLVPQIMYHTTRNDVSSFEVGRKTVNSGTFGNWETQRHAIFVTPEREASQAYGTEGGGFADGANVMPLYVKAENPLDLTSGASEDVERRLIDAGMSPRYVNQLGHWEMFDDENGKDVVEIIKKAGYDSVIFNDQNPDTGDSFESWAVFAPEQIKSAIGNNGNFDPNDPDIRRSKSDALGFYSQLERAIESAPIKAAPAEQWKAWLNGNAGKLGVKADEIQWSGITDWLDMQKGKVTRESVSEYLANNGVQVEETVLGGKLSKGRAQALRPDVIAALRKNDNLGFDTPGEALSALINDFGENKDALSNWDFDSGETRNLVADFLEAYHEENAAPPRYESYVLPGGQNYRELLLTLPEEKAPKAGWSIRQHASGKWAVYAPEGYRLDELYPTHAAAVHALPVAPDGPQFSSGHWDQPNVLAHIRFNERTDTAGARVMFVEEIQSDWGQEGKKKGFAEPTLLAPLKEELARARAAHTDAVAEVLRSDDTPDNTVAAEARVRTAALALDAENRRQQSRVPAAPFVTKTEAWVALALKRAITYAVQNGFDKVAFTNGQQNADRYDLSKQLDTLLLDKWPQGGGEITGRKGGFNVVNKKVFNDADIADVVGKDIAQKLIDAPKNEYGMHELSGLDLKVGGEGMVAFYDKIVPQVARDVLKKIGGGQMTIVEVNLATDTAGYAQSNVWIMDENDRGLMSYKTRAEAERMLPSTQAMYPGKKLRIVENAPEEKRSAQPGFGITPAMRAKVAEGLPRFSRAQEDTPEFKAWFGDSKVVDEKGEPLVVYHATPSDFATFVPGGANPNLSGAAIWATPDKENQPAAHNTRAVPGEPNRVYGLRSGKFSPGTNVMPLYVRITEPLVSNDNNWRQIYADTSGGSPWILYPDAVAAIKANGHDGIMHYDRNGVLVEVAAFDPEQIKSAIGNNGEFNPGTSDIRRSRAPGSTYLFGLLEADELGNIRSRQTHKIRELGSRVLKPLAIKLRMNRAPESLRRAMREMEATVERAQRTAIAVAGEMREMTDVEAGVISDIVEQELQAGVIPPNELVDVAAKIGRAMSEQTDELLRLGMIDQAAADRWRGKYLPRFYESKLTKKIDPWLKAIMDAFHNRKPVLGVKGNHLRGRGKLERITVEQLDDYRAQGWAIRDDGYDAATSTWVTVWKDYTRDEREQMGEIRDARFRFIMGYIATQKDIALGRLFERLADTDASDVAREGDVQVPRLLVPETGVMRYGKLAGKWVSQEIFNHISKYNDTAAYEDLLKIYRKAYGAWKESKTVLNPVAHANNVMGNVTMAHFAGVSYWDAHKYALAARDLMAKNSPMVEEARDHGLFLGTITQEEMLAALPEPLRVLAGMQENTGEKAVRHVWNALSWWLRRPAGAAYKWEDLFFRYLIYRDARTRGLGAEDAVDYAERFVFAYNDLPQGARIIRDTALPFFSWTYKAVPTMLSTALDYPWRYAAPAIVLSTINAAMYAMAFGDGDDDWWQRIGKYITDPEHRAKVNEHEAWERKNLPPWMKGASIMFGAKKTIRLGTDEVTQHPVFMDVSRVLPAGDLLDTDSNAGGVPWFQSLTPNHPLFTTAFALFGNKDLWSGKEIVQRTKHGQDIETGSEKAGAYAGWLWRQFTPAIALGNYHFNRALNATAQAAGTTIPGWPDDYTGVGRDGLPVQPKYAIEQTVGIKARPIDLSFSEMMEGLNKKEIISALEAEIRRTRSLAAKGIISEAAAEKEVKRVGEKLERVAKGLTVSGDEKK